MAARRAEVVTAATIGSGYETPAEEDVPAYLTPPGIDEGGPITRPAFVQRPSQLSAGPCCGKKAPRHIQGSNSNLNSMIAHTEKLAARSRKVGFRDRIACYQWTYFTMTMATGGVANVIHSLHWSSAWITGVGLFFLMLNMVLFLTNCVLLSMRFYLRPGSFTNSFTDQFESLFIPSFFVSMAVIMINICAYGIPHTGVWLVRAMEAMFWFYVALSVVASAGLYLILWSTLVFPVHTMTPTWVFPAYPLLLTAPFAANLIAASQKSSHSLSINVTAIGLCAATTQGTGCLIAFMISAAFIYRLMTQKLPRDTQRPGVFISIGPFGFTAAGITQLGKQASIIVPPNFLDIDDAASIIKVISVLVGLWTWGLAIWFFVVSVGSLWKYLRVAATEVMGDVFQSKGIQVCGAVMTVILIAVWVGVFVTMVHCLRTKKILWPKHNE